MMTVRLTDEKVKSLIQACQNLLDNISSSIREVARSNESDMQKDHFDDENHDTIEG